MARVTEIARFDNAFEAHRIASLLSEAGIEAEVDAGHSGGLFSHISGIGIRVVVAEEDRARAEAVLAEVLPAPADDLRDDGTGDDEDPFDDASPSAADAAADGPTARTAAEREVAETPAPLHAADNAAVAWARRTRLIAWVGCFFFLLLVGAVFRITAPPEGVLDDPEARAIFAQARTVTRVALAVYGLAALLAFMIHGMGAPAEV